MREIRTSGSEGGAAQSNASSLPLSLMAKLEAESMQRPMKPAPTKDHRENNCAQTNQNYPFSALDVSEKEGE